ncbi:MAG: sensor histidine kinase [Chitinophagales bacterium]
MQTNHLYLKLNFVFFLILFVLLSSYWAFGQTPQPYPLEVPEDFSVKTIYELHEDVVTGDMWMGTGEGLYRYDGVEFQNYVHSDYSTDLSGVNQDSTGRVWCQNFSGQIFYVEGDSLKLFLNHANYENNFPTYWVEFPTIYLSSSYGYLEVDFHTKEEKRRYLQIDSTNYKVNLKGDTLFRERIIKIKGNNNRLFFLKPHQLFSIERNNPTSSIDSTPNLSHLTGPISFIFSADTVLIFANTLGKKSALAIEWIIGKSAQQQEFEPFMKKISSPSIFQEKVDNSYWLGLENGLMVLNQNYHSFYGEQKILEGKTVSDVIKDMEGNYWIGTLNNGIYMLPSKNILTWNSENNSLNNNELSAIITDDRGNIYILEQKGLVWRLNLKTHTLEPIFDFEAKGKKLFYDSYHHVLYCQYSTKAYDLENQKKISVKQGNIYKSIHFIDAENLIASHFKGVQITHREPSTPPMDSLWRNNAGFLLINSTDKKAIELRNRRSAYNCYDTSEQRIWVGYTNGLFHYKDAIEKETKYQGKAIVVNNLISAKKGGIWVSTIDKTILHIQDAKVVNEIWVGETIFNIKEWENNLFLGTHKGVYKYNLDNQTTEIFNTLDGLPSDNITGLEVVNDTLYIATNNGLTFIPTDYTTINTVPPNISISKVAIWEKDTTLLSNYYLSAFNNNLKIEFKGRSIRSQGTMKYKYRMLGLDSSWVQILSNNNVVRYPSLPSGDYLFEVKTINEDGVESIDPAKVYFFIDSPYYLKWWFFLLVIGGVAALISSFFLFRIKAIRKQSELISSQQNLETKLIQSQLTALRSQMNPHFMFNALNSIQEYTLTNQKELASDYLGKFSDLMRLYLNHSRADGISLREELDALDLYLDLEKLRFEDSLHYKISIAPNIIAEDILIPSMLIQPYVENAIKHGLFHKKTNRQLSIEFVLNSSNALVCIIQDNGIGRRQSMLINKLRKNKPSSFATSAIQNRLSLLNQSRSLKIEVITRDLANDAFENCGTEVTIIIP